MNIYMLRDRLIGYWMPPFLGPSDGQIKAALSTLVNSGSTTDAIAQAPHHFELWKIGTVEDGQNVLSSEQTFICDLSSLLRGSLREPQPSAGTPLEGDRQTQGTAGETQRQAE